uniref:Internal virion protein n=1 Tax=uncultured marine virus TaxID=186617 RepID=A0A0F7LAA2_9VIRU|nr:internal virion protein [uncultured marine virus]
MLDDDAHLGALTSSLQCAFIDHSSVSVNEDRRWHSFLTTVASPVAELDQAFVVPFRERSLNPLGVGSFGSCPLQELLTISLGSFNSLGRHDEAKAAVVELAAVLKDVDEAGELSVEGVAVAICHVKLVR